MDLAPATLPRCLRVRPLSVAATSTERIVQRTVATANVLFCRMAHLQEPKRAAVLRPAGEQCGEQMGSKHVC